MNTVADATRTVADRLVELCKQGQHLAAVEQLYSDRIVSIEAMDCLEGEAETMPRRMEGIEAIRGKNQWWMDNHEVHGGGVSGPFMHDPDRFAVVFDYDVTYKPQGRRCQMQEVGVYTVGDGKIVQEEFFYTMPG